MRIAYSAPRKYFSLALLLLLGVFAVALVQNFIRYGIHDSYNIWNSVLYLLVSVLLFAGFLPFIYQWCGKRLQRPAKQYFIYLISLSSLVMLGYYLLSGIVIHLFGYYDQPISAQYARSYFGREALFHVLVVAGTGIYRYYFQENHIEKRVRATMGRKEVTINANDIRWIAADDHYLHIHVNGQSLLKRASLEQMVSELKPDFIRIHRKYLVNRNYIISKERQKRDEYVVLGSGERLKVGRSYAPLEW